MIDAFCHILPPKYKEALYRMVKKGNYAEKHLNLEAEYEKIPALFDLEARFKIMDQNSGMRQVLTVSGIPLEAAVNQPDAAFLAKLANDEVAELVDKYPDRFIAGVATLPMNDMEATITEAIGAIKELKLKGVQIYTPSNGKPIDAPEFLPLYQLLAEYELPIWLHPYRPQEIPDFAGESYSKYRLFHIFGWPYETSLSMARLVFSGVLELFPGLKFITHHCGGMLPFFAKRLASQGRRMVEQEGYTDTRLKLSQPVLDYFKAFYGDTALTGHVPALICGYEFFGPDRILFATDMPYGGLGDVENIIKSIDALAVTAQNKDKILEGNIKKLLHIN